MDPLSGLLDHPRARGAFTLRVVMDPPWSIDVRDEAALTVVVVLRGSGRLVADGRGTEMRAGDVAVVRGPQPYVVEHLGDGTGPEVLPGPLPAASPHPSLTSAVIGPDQSCTTPDGADLHLAMAHGTHTWGNAVDGADSLLVATYPGTSEAGRLATEALPRVAHVPAGSGPGTALVDLLVHELTTDQVGQSTVVDRLVDVVLVATVRAWLAAHPDDAPGWLSTAHDPVVHGALRAIHDRPAEPWTVLTLAREVDVSRATFAARFRTQVGSPPMAYLTRWRLTLAADLLTATDRTLASIAADVGYGSAFALSAAFSQQMGTSPSRYRRQRA
jgi:AraC-like DNA-binding protein